MEWALVACFFGGCLPGRLVRNVGELPITSHTIVFFIGSASEPQIQVSRHRDGEEFPTFCGSRKIVVLLTRARHGSLLLNHMKSAHIRLINLIPFRFCTTWVLRQNSDKIKEYQKRQWT
jgi:hypothetical protein